MKKQLQELKQEFSNFSTSQNEYVVISHFVGNKNINEILMKLAQKQAYSEMF